MSNQLNNLLSPALYETPFLDKHGRVSPPWQWWFRSVSNRLGTGTQNNIADAAEEAAAADVLASIVHLDRSDFQDYRNEKLQYLYQPGPVTNLEDLENLVKLALFSPQKPENNITVAADNSTTPYYIPTSEVFVNPINKQNLYNITIVVDGILEANGLVVQVD